MRILLFRLVLSLSLSLSLFLFLSYAATIKYPAVTKKRQSQKQNTHTHTNTRTTQTFYLLALDLCATSFVCSEIVESMANIGRAFAIGEGGVFANNKQVVLVAVAQNGEALRYAP